jgi:hypothetical protein
MTPRSVVVLLLLGVLALGGGWYFGVGHAPDMSVAEDAGKLMFPGLAPKLADAARIEIVHQGKTLAIGRNGDVWGLVDRGLYPVPREKLRAMLTALTELRLTEQRTADANELSRLGLEDPAKPDGTSNLLRVLDGGGKPIAALVVGHRRVRTRGGVPDTIYVRRPDDSQSWLAEGKLEVDADPQTWLDRDILNIAHDRIASVAMTRGAERLEFARDGDRLVLKSPAAHPALDEDKIDDIGRVLETLTLQDVQPAKDAPGEQVAETIFTRDDGLAVTVRVLHAGKDVWARLAAAGPDKVKDEAEKLNARLAGWSYQVGAWKEKALAPSLDDLKAPPPREAAPPAPAAKP